MDWAFDITLKNRKLLASFLNDFSLDELNKIPKGFSNNIFWNIAHVIVTQQLLTYNLSGLSMLIDDELVNTYRKGSKAKNEITEYEVARVQDLLFSTLERTKEDYKKGLFKKFQEYTVTTKSTLTNIDQAIEFNNFHEGIHLGYILAMKKSL